MVYNNKILDVSSVHNSVNLRGTVDRAYQMSVLPMYRFSSQSLLIVVWWSFCDHARSGFNEKQDSNKCYVSAFCYSEGKSDQTLER